MYFLLGLARVNTDTLTKYFTF